MDKRKTLQTKGKLFLAAIILCALLFYALCGAFAVKAEDGGVYLQNDDAKNHFWYFESPSMIASDDSLIYVADSAANGKTVTVFNRSGKAQRTALLPAGVTDIYASSGNLYAVLNGGISHLGFNEHGISALQKIAPDGFTRLVVSENDIFALNADGVHRFDKITLNRESAAPAFGGLNIDNFTFSDGVLYGIKNSVFDGGTVYYHDLSAQKSGIALSDTGNMSDIVPVSGGIGLLSYNGLSLYEKGISRLSLKKTVPLDRALTASASGGTLHILNAYKTILGMSESDFVPTELILSSGGGLGFYRNPASVSSRFGRLIVTDTGNNRVIADNGETLIELPLTAPVDAATDSNGIIYVLNSENKITSYSFDAYNACKKLTDISVKLIDENNETVDGAGLTRIATDINDNFYIIDDNNLLYTATSASGTFKQCYGKKAYAISGHIKYGPTVFLLTDGDNGGSAVVRLNNGTDATTVLATGSSEKILDISADENDAFYLLFSGNKIRRYEPDGGAYIKTDEKIIQNAHRLTKISVSNIHFDAQAASNAPLFRDIIAIDAEMHRTVTVSAASFGVTYDDPSRVLTKADIAVRKLSDAEIKGSLIRRVTPVNGTNVYAQDSEVKIIAHLNRDFGVIVPDYDPALTYTKIIADRINANAADQPIVGYVRTSDISADPQDYTKPPVRESNVWLDEIKIYPVPAKQSVPISLSNLTILLLQDFVMSDNLFGFRDNFIEDEFSKSNNYWYRIVYEIGGITYEGYITASSVSVLGGNPDLNIRPRYNAEIISKNKSAPSEGANVYYYDAATDSYLQFGHEYNYLEIGTRVEVIGIFDPSQKYTKIHYYTPYGTMEGFVETANINYRGITMAQIIAVIIILTAAALVSILIIRRVKSQKKNKL